MVTAMRRGWLVLFSTLGVSFGPAAQEAAYDPARPTALGMLQVVRELAAGGDIADRTRIERALRIDLALWLIAEQSPETERRFWLFYRPLEPFLTGPTVGFSYDKQSRPPSGPATDLHARLLLGNIDSYGCATSEDVSRILKPGFEERPHFKDTGSREFIVAETAYKVVWVTVVLWQDCVGSISIVQTN
jgi:hypothetical protein